MKCKIRLMYLCVKDMERAIHFYEELFKKKVTVIVFQILMLGVPDYR